MDWLFILFDRFKLGMTGFCAGVREAADAMSVFSQKSASVSSKNSGVFLEEVCQKKWTGIMFLYAMLHLLKYICDLTQKLEHDSGTSESGFDFIPFRSC